MLWDSRGTKDTTKSQKGDGFCHMPKVTSGRTWLGLSPMKSTEPAEFLAMLPQVSNWLAPDLCTHIHKQELLLASRQEGHGM